MYRFGDATPFPLQENFIDTLEAGIDCCVELFRAEASIEHAEASARDARREAGEELRRLDILSSWLEESLDATASEYTGTRTASVAMQIATTARERVRSSKMEIVRLRDMKIESSRPADLEARMSAALAAFLRGHQLPGMQWSLRWRVEEDGRGVAELRGTVDEILVVFRATGPSGTHWSAPTAVRKLVENVEVTTTHHKKRRKHAPTEVQLNLDDYEILAIDSTPSRQRMLLRHPKRGDQLVLVLRDPEASGPFTTRVDAEGRSYGPRHGISNGQMEAVDRLWRQISDSATQLIAARTTLVRAALGNDELDAIERPARIAEAILEILAPLVREMRLRSRVPGELILKRDLGGDRREELFVPRAALQDKFATLPDHFQRIFEAMGLGSESTQDFASRATALDVMRSLPTGNQRAASPRLRTVGKAPTEQEIARAQSMAESLECRDDYGFDTVVVETTALGDEPGDEDEEAA